MYIANPIYDSVFKYLMDDNAAARLLLSAIIGEEIISLEYRRTDQRVDLQPKLTVLYIDFAAKIRSLKGGERLVILEIQKAKYATDIMRFRKYLGTEYANPENVEVLSEPRVVYQTRPLPIVSIYFLGYKLDVVKAPVIKVQREYRDVTTGEIIREKEVFIESLTHDSFIIQIPYLCEQRQTELLQLLGVFDQSKRAVGYHMLDIKERDFPKRYSPVVRRLQRAVAEPEVQQKMDAEDLFIEYLKDTERTVEEKDKALKEKNRIIANLKKKLGK